MPAVLQVRDLRTSILKRVSFTLSAAECIAVKGPSGAGKTLLLRAIADLDPNQGVVTLDGRDRSTIAAPEWRRLVGYVPAEPGWWAETVGEHFREWQADRGPTTCGRGWTRLPGDRPMASYIELSYWDLAAASVLVLIDAALSIIFGLRIHRSLLVAATRMTVQLALVGLVLTFLFAVVSPLWTGLAALGMILF